ncbi:MAG: leucine-rich repeat domain-containing protein, partial [Holosporales bacterium]
IRLMGYMASLDLTHIELTHALGQSKNFFSQLARNECLIQKLSLEGTLTTNRSTGLLRGLAELRFLKSLNLSWNQFFITDFEEITKLTQLEELIWRTNPFTNHISHLTALHNLRVLDLQSSKTEVSLEKLSSFTALEELNLSKTSQPINGLKHLQHFHGLRSLNLANCGMIKDASGVLLPQSLEILNVNQCALAAQPRVLTHLTRLVDLEIAGNRLGDALLEIAPLSRLTRLVAGHNDAPRSLTFLEQFTNLQGLHLAGNTQISTDFLRSLTNLRALSLASALLSEVEEDLHPLKNLFFLDLAKNPIQHLRNLSCGNTLQILNIEGTGLQFLTELTGLSQLKKVTLSNNSWNDLDQTLGFFTGLTELNSENLNMGAHLLALTSLSRLQVLNLDNNVLRKGPGSYHVPQMTVLETLRALKKLSVQKTELFKSDPILEALSKRNVEIVRDHRIGSKKFS